MSPMCSYLKKTISFCKSLLKENIQKVVIFFATKNPQPFARISQVHLHITDECVLKCKMCNIWKIPKSQQQKPLTFAQAKIILDKLYQWNGPFFLTFTGGETFLDPDLPDIIKYAHSLGLKTSVNTNGVLIQEKLAKKIINSGINTVFFSIDGLETEHDSIRGVPGTFHKALNAIHQLQRLRKNSPLIYINTVISNNNIEQLPQLIQLARKEKLDGINFQAIMPNFSSHFQERWFQKNPFWIKDTTILKKVLTDIKQIKRKNPTFILNTFEDIDHMYTYFSQPLQYQKSNKCLVGLANMMISTNGDVQLCYEMPKIGNIFRQNPAEIWTSDLAEKRRQQISQCQKPCKLLPCNDLFQGYLFSLKEKLLHFFLK